MRAPCIICVAITGSLPRKENNSAVPISVAEEIESSHAAFEAGATIMHAHVRNADQTPSSDPDKFAALQEGIKKHSPGMIIQFSTGGRSGAGQERGGMLPLRPDMAFLSVGSNNFPTRVSENPPDLVDWLAAEMHKRSQIADTPYVPFVMGVKNAMPADRGVFDFYVETVKRLFGPDVPWCAAGIGMQQIVLNEWSVSSGGHARTGLEDNVRLDKDTLAPSNAALVQRVAGLCEQHERPVATPAQARQLLGLA
jgi:3-keto-5-aminohexanoate cleavage enzyme